MRTLILFLALTLPLAAQEPKTVKLTLSPETTYLTEPQLPDGRIDYLAALNEMLSAKTTPENNLVVGLCTLVTDDLDDSLENVLSLQTETDKEKNKQEAVQQYREQFFKMIGIDPPSLESLIEITPCSETKDCEKELLECYSKEELADMIHKQREEQKDDYKTRLDDGTISKEQYEEEIQKIELDTQEVCRLIIERQWYDAMGRPWTAKEFPYLAKWLESTNEWTPRLIALSRERTGYYSPQISESELFYDVQLPYVQTLRQCARYFQCRGNFEFARGNYDEAMECSFTAIRLGQTLRKNACWIVEDLVGVSMIGLGTAQLSKHLTALSGKKDAAWILQKKKEYDALKVEIGYGTSIPMWCLHERLALLGIAQAAAVNHESIRNDDFKIMFDNDIVIAQYEKFFDSGIAYDWDEILRRINRFYDDVADICLLPNWQRRLRAAARLNQRIIEHAERSKSPDAHLERRVVDFWLGDFGLSIEPMMMAQTRSEWGQSVTSVAFALSAYRVDNDGKSPDSLDQLVPKYIESVPLSPFTNKPLRYIKRERDVLITNDDEYKLDGSEAEVEKKIAEAKPGEWAYPANDHYVFVVSKD